MWVAFFLGGGGELLSKGSEISGNYLLPTLILIYKRIVLLLESSDTKLEIMQFMQIQSCMQSQMHCTNKCLFFSFKEHTKKMNFKNQSMDGLFLTMVK